MFLKTIQYQISNCLKNLFVAVWIRIQIRPEHSYQIKHHFKNHWPFLASVRGQHYLSHPRVSVLFVQLSLLCTPQFISFLFSFARLRPPVHNYRSLGTASSADAAFWWSGFRRDTCLTDCTLGPITKHIQNPEWCMPLLGKWVALIHTDCPQLWRAPAQHSRSF